jgi:hypothetical protein
MTEADVVIPDNDQPTEWTKQNAEQIEWEKKQNPDPSNWVPENEFPSSSPSPPNWVPENEFPSSSPHPSNWVPENEFPSSSSPNANANSPGYAPLSPASPIPNFPDEMMKQEWTRLPYQQQQDILNHPLDEQITIMKQIISDRPATYAGPSNFEDAELQKYFTQLPKEEQIELLKLSHERQIDKLKEMSRSFRPEPGLKIVVPKTASEELYEGKLSLMAPTESLKPASKTKDDDIVAADSSEPSNKGGTKKITII